MLTGNVLLTQKLKRNFARLGYVKYVICTNTKLGYMRRNKGCYHYKPVNTYNYCVPINLPIISDKNLLLKCSRKPGIINQLHANNVTSFFVLKKGAIE